MKRTVVTLPLYGKERIVRYRSKALLGADIRLTPEQMVEFCAKRWSIESMFHQLKQARGLKEA